MKLKDWGTLSPLGDNRPRLEDCVRVADKKQYTGKYHDYRFVGQVTSYEVVWLPLYKDGKPMLNKEKKPIKIPKIVTNYDPEKESANGNECPYRKLAEKMNQILPADDQVRVQRLYIGNAIDRILQENPPRRTPRPLKEEAASGFKSMDSDTFTPVVVHNMNGTIVKKCQSLSQLNTIVSKKTGKKIEKSIADERYGCDIALKFLPNEKGSAMYDVQKRERSPLTDQEKEYLVWNLTDIEAIKPEPLSSAKEEAARLEKAFFYGRKPKLQGDDADDGDDLPFDIDDDDDDAPKSKTKTKRRQRDDDDDDDIDLELNDDDDDDEEEERKSSRKAPVGKKTSKKKRVARDDDDDDDLVTTKRKTRSSRDDDEDEDTDDDLEELSDLDDLDDIDDDDDSDDDDEEETKPQTRRSRPTPRQKNKRLSSKKRRPITSSSSKKRIGSR